MNFEEALQYMSGLLRFGWKLGNERFEELCARMGNPQDRYKIVHVAGTKGKGSTTALSAALLRAAGFHVGGYFSPYVYDVCERVQVNREYIPHEAFARLITQAKAHIEALAETEFGQTTEFELKTLLGFLYFAERNVDYACIEVGLGGRLDATNLVKPTVTVITNIGLDHIPQLGDTHALIAGEKAGIIKPGIPCFTAVDHPDALAVITRIAQERGASLMRVVPSPDFSLQGSEEEFVTPSPSGEGWGGDSVHWSVPEGQEHTGTVTITTSRAVYRELEMRMGGVYQRANAACAVAAVEEALAREGKTLPEAAVREALATTTLPGRLTILRVPDGPLVVLDGAHNEMAAQALAGPVEALRAQYGIKRTLLVIGMLNGHEPEGVLAALAPQAERIIVCQPEWKRALPADEMAKVARLFTRKVKSIPSVLEAARAALAEAGPKDMILITGSFYTVGEVPLTLFT